MYLLSLLIHGVTWRLNHSPSWTTQVSCIKTFIMWNALKIFQNRHTRKHYFYFNSFFVLTLSCWNRQMQINLYNKILFQWGLDAEIIVIAFLMLIMQCNAGRYQSLPDVPIQIVFNTCTYIWSGKHLIIRYIVHI